MKGLVEGLTGRLALLVWVAVSTVLFAVIVGSGIYLWNTGMGVLAILLGVAWVAASVPWIFLTIVVIADVIRFFRSGRVLIIPFITTLVERAEEDPLLRSELRDPKKWKRVAGYCAAATYPLLPALFGIVSVIRGLPVDSRRVSNMYDDFRDTTLGRRHRVVNPIVQVGSDVYGRINSHLSSLRRGVPGAPA